MNHNDIRNRIQAATATFTNEIAAVFAEAFSSAAADLGLARTAAPKAAAKRTRATPAPAAQAAPAARKPGKPGKRIRRSLDELGKIGEQVVKLLGGNKKGLRIEQINRQLGTSTKQLARPILKLLEEGRIKKSGEKRATTYVRA